MTKREVLKRLEAVKARSAWKKGVKFYAEWLLDQYDDANLPLNEKTLLDGARDWKAFSWGGCAFCYDKDIAEILCTATELKITRHGERRPNAREEWLDVQARALYQAARLIRDIIAGEKSL